MSGFVLDNQSEVSNAEFKGIFRARFSMIGKLYPIDLSGVPDRRGGESGVGCVNGEACLCVNQAYLGEIDQLLS